MLEKQMAPSEVALVVRFVDASLDRCYGNHCMMGELWGRFELRYQI